MQTNQKLTDSKKSLTGKEISFLLISQEKLIELKQSFTEYQKTITELKEELQLKNR